MAGWCFRTGKFCDAEKPERETGEGREEWPPRASLDRCPEIMEIRRRVALSQVSGLELPYFFQLIQKVTDGHLAIDVDFLFLFYMSIG